MIVLAGAFVYDGTGGPAFRGDVHVCDGRIADLRPASDYHPGATVVDVSGRCVAPGFIDVHSHNDNGPFSARDAWKVEQGITTDVVGNCGISLAPHNPAAADGYFASTARTFAGVPHIGPRFRDLLAETDRRGYVTNYAPLVGHGNLRQCSVGSDDREASAAEMGHMLALLAEALDAGAFGMSTGLIYPPGMFAGTDELVTLAAALAPWHIFTSHMRNESDAVERSVEEIVEIGTRSGRRVHISHHKAAGAANWGASERTLLTMAAARANGIAVTQDVYPYTAGSTALSAVLPRAYHNGGDAALLKRLSAVDAVEKLRAALAHGEPRDENLIDSAGWDGILIASTADHRFEGRTIAQLAGDLSLDPVAVIVRVLVEEQLNVWMVVFLMHEGDIERILSDPWTSIGTDGAPAGSLGKPHPRTFGTFPRILGTYARERAVLSLEEAIRRMTSLAADTFGIPERGRLCPGWVADIVVFDASTVDDDCDYLDSVRQPRGIDLVLVGGKRAVAGGRFSGERFGTRLQPAQSAA